MIRTLFLNEFIQKFQEFHRNISEVFQLFTEENL